MSVYFAQAGGYVKIGFSDNPFGRASTVTTAGKRPADLPRGAATRLLGWVPGDRLTEGGWHFRFAADHVAGEWFYIDPDMVRDLIWEDPCGIDVRRMSAWAVMVADRQPGLTRDEMEAAGVPIMAVSVADSPMFNQARAIA